MSTATTTPTPTTLGLTPTFGFGDRMGLATPGHLAALRAAGGPIHGIFAQQSIREMARTSRQPEDVMSAAQAALADAGFDQPWGADADHLKTPEDVDRTLAAGFTFFTIDPSAHVDQHADGYDAGKLDAEFEKARDSAPWFDAYLNRTVTVPGGPRITFDEAALKRAAVKYGRAIAHAVSLAGYITASAQKANRPAELEISIDETEQPTTVGEHYLIADQLRAAGVQVVSLAPRYPGDLEKGVDYKGDLAYLEAVMRDHAAIAEHLGPYKLSLHSGSDKLSIYGLFGRCTGGRFHVKTAGTSYLEALRVVAHHDPALFRRIVTFSRARYDTDKATYHVSATLAEVPPPDALPDAAALETTYLERWDSVPAGAGFTAPGRQILHCTFGSVLCDGELGPAIRGVLTAHPDTHRAILEEHFARHLRALRGEGPTASA
jgi:tagaturonate epimerase